MPDVPECVATDATVEEVKRNLAEALQFHFEGMRADGDTVPQPTSAVNYEDVLTPTKRVAG